MKMIIDEIISDVGDLPDRTSPEGQPDMMLVTAEELEIILQRHFEAVSRVVHGYLSEMTADNLDAVIVVFPMPPGSTDYR